MFDVKNLFSIKQLVQNNYCVFEFLRSGTAYYRLDTQNNDDENTVLTFQFTIPLDDIGNGSLNNREKAITLMRWIRKAYENNELVLVSQWKKDLVVT